jgi:hypothetical protein
VVGYTFNLDPLFISVEAHLCLVQDSPLRSTAGTLSMQSMSSQKQTKKNTTFTPTKCSTAESNSPLPTEFKTLNLKRLQQRGAF